MAAPRMIKASPRHSAQLAILPLMTVAALALVIASILHFGVTVRIGGATLSDSFRDAPVPEAVIAAVLVGGTLGVAMRFAWGVALGSTLFAVIGFLIGLRFTLFGGEQHPIGDVIYHFAGLALLVATVGLLLSPAGRAALRAAPDGQGHRPGSTAEPPSADL